MIKRLISLGVVGAIIFVIALKLNVGGTGDLKIYPDLFQPSKELVKENAVMERVIDGDTILVTKENGAEERVRLLLIDTPESVHPNKEKELYGEESSDYAKSVLKKGDQVTLEIGKPDRDKYNRLLAYVWVDDFNFNQLMVEKGFARVGYVYEPNTKYLEEFKEAEERAKESGENIWSIENYVTEDGFDMSAVK